MISKYLPAVIIAGIIASLAPISDANCYRHIYNNSSETWTFQATDMVDEHVYFSGGRGTRKDGPYAVPASATLYVKYTTDAGHIGGSMQVTDASGNQKAFEYGSDGAEGNCMKIGHTGSTPPIGLNDPAGGDYTITGNFWPSK